VASPEGLTDGGKYVQAPVRIEGVRAPARPHCARVPLPASRHRHRCCPSLPRSRPLHVGFSPSHRTQAAAALRRACAALAHVSLVRAAVVATTLMLGACTERSLPTTPVAASVPAGPSRLLITTPVSYADVSAGAYHTCAVNTLGVLTCWAGTAMGRRLSRLPHRALRPRERRPRSHVCREHGGGAHLLGEQQRRSTTVPDAATSGIAQVSAGGYHTCALSTTGRLPAGARYRRPERRARYGDDNMIQVSAGALHTCAITTAPALGTPIGRCAAGAER
jgi:hypothetical protein